MPPLLRKSNIFILIFSLGFFCPLHSAISDEEEEATEIIPVTEPIYDFTAHLSEASAVVQVEGDEVSGQWETDHFTFEKLGERHQVRIQEGKFKDKKKSGIYFYPVKNGSKRLIFHKVPTGSHIFVEYGIDDAGVDELQETSNVFLRVWLGNHLLKRIVVSNQKGWYQESLDLGVVSFLNEPVVVCFEINSDSIQGRHFYFKSAIY